MTTPSINITGEEFINVYNHGWSLDKYARLRTAASNEQAIEVLEAGNIDASSYLRCIRYGETHEEILRVASEFAIVRSKFNWMVQQYVGPGVTLRVGAIAYQNNIPSGGSGLRQNVPALREVLEHTSIEELVDAWQQLTPRMNERTFLRFVAGGRKPEKALAVLHR